MSVKPDLSTRLFFGGGGGGGACDDSANSSWFGGKGSWRWRNFLSLLQEISHFGIDQSVRRWQRWRTELDADSEQRRRWRWRWWFRLHRHKKFQFRSDNSENGVGGAEGKERVEVWW